MEISSASTLKGFAVIRREGVNPQPAGAEGVDGIESGINKAVADVIDISTEGRSFANQEENDNQSEEQERSPLFDDNPKESDKSTLVGQQPGNSSGATITAAVLSGSPDDSVPLTGEEPDDGSQAEPIKQPQAPAPKGAGINKELTDEEKQIVNELKQRDAKVRAHEHAHLAAAGQYASGGISYTYQQGPDGRQYAIGGEVGISMPSGDSPEESLRIARQVERAAIAPAEPSSADRAIAAAARAKASQAMRDMSAQAVEEAKSNREEASTTNGNNTPTGVEQAGQEIPIAGTGQPQGETEPEDNSDSDSNPFGRASGSEAQPLGRINTSDTDNYGGVNQKDEPTTQSSAIGSVGIQGSSSDIEVDNPTGEDNFPELIDIVSVLDRDKSADSDDPFGTVSESSGTQSQSEPESIESLFSLVDSL